MPEDYFPGLRSILYVASLQSSTMLEKNLDLAQADAIRHMAQAALYPTVNGTANYATSNSSVATSGRDSSSSSSGLLYGINASQNLFQWGAVKAGADIAEIGRKIAEKQLVEAYRILAMTLRGQYLSLIVKKAVLRVTRQQLALLQQDFEAKAESIRLGESAPAEISGAEMNRDRARLNLDLQEQDLVNAKRVIVRLAGLTDLTEAEIPDEIPLPRETSGIATALLDPFLRQGVTQTSQAEVLAYTVRQNALRVTVAKSGTRPKFFLGGGYGLSNSTSVDGVGNLSQAAVGSRSYSVSMGWTLWDGGATKWNTRSAQNAKSNAERALNNFIAANRDDAEQKAKQVDFAYRQMALVERDRESVLGGFNLEKVNYGLGLSAKNAVDRAGVSYSATEVTAFSARAAFLQQWAEFVSFVNADPVMYNLPPTYLNHGQ